MGKLVRKYSLKSIGADFGKFPKGPHDNYCAHVITGKYIGILPQNIERHSWLLIGCILYGTGSKLVQHGYTCYAGYVLYF